MLLLIVLLFADFHISRFLLTDYEDRRFQSWSDIYNNKLESKVLINGSSRAWTQYNPKILDSILHIDSYNLGIDGSGINRQILKYETYCRIQNNSPYYLIQNIDFNTLKITIGYEREQFFPFLWYDKILFNEIDKYEVFNLFEKYSPCYRYIGYHDLNQSAFGLVPRYEKSLYKGYCGQNVKWDGKEYFKQNTLQYCQDSEALKMFDQFLAEVKASGTKIIFVYAPIYIGVTKKIENIEGMYIMYDSIAKKYDIPILDYNYDPISYDTTYFYNAMHLNRTGSNLFSTKLAHDIDSLGLLK